MSTAQERRYGFIGLIISQRNKNGRRIQEILEHHAHLIHGRMGLPHLAEDRLSIITLIVHASTDELGSLTGQLGRVEGVIVKSAMAKALDLPDDVPPAPGTGPDEALSPLPGITPDEARHPGTRASEARAPEARG